MANCVRCKKKLKILEGFEDGGKRYCDKCWAKITGEDKNEERAPKLYVRWCRKCGLKQQIPRERINPSSIIGILLLIITGGGFISTSVPVCKRCGSKKFSKTKITKEMIKKDENYMRILVSLTFVFFFSFIPFLLDWHVSTPVVNYFLYGLFEILLFYFTWVAYKYDKKKGEKKIDERCSNKTISF